MIQNIDSSREVLSEITVSKFDKIASESLPRCSSCSTKCSVGKKAPIRLSCGHILCFSCHMSEFVTDCPVDKSPILGQAEYCNPNENQLLPTCHGSHSFIDYAQNPIYRLPCRHYSCTECSNMNRCMSCNTDFEVSHLKVAKSKMNISEFCSFFCKDHNLPARYFSVSLYRFYCADCNNASGIPLQFVSNVSSVINIITSVFLLRKQHVESLDNFLPPDFLKKCLYFNVLDYNTRYNISRKLIEVDEMGTKVESSYTIQMRFKHLLPGSNIKSSKKWEMDKGEDIKIYISTESSIILAGIVLGGRYHEKSHNLQLQSRPFAIKSIKISLSGKLMLHITNSLISFERENKIEFKKSLVLEKDQKYLLEIEVPEGIYYHGRPYSVNNSGPIKVSKCNPFGFTTRIRKNYVIGGPVLGFLIKHIDIDS